MLALTACSSSVDVVRLDKVAVLVASDSEGGMDAALQGELAVVGGCLGVFDTVVVWPEGTKVLGGDPLRIEVPELGTLGVGDEVSLGGGIVEPPGGSPVEVAGVTIPSDCTDYDIWVASQP